MSEKEVMKNPKTTHLKLRKNDVFLVCVLLFLAFASFFVLNMQKKSGGYVLVKVDGKVTNTFGLNENCEYLIKTKAGKNRLVISDGFANVVDADCKDCLCVKQKKISKTSETIVCLPHKVVIEVVSDKEADLDAITN